MTERNVTVSLQTKHIEADMEVRHYLNPDVRILSALSFNAVLAMTIESQAIIHNTVQSSEIDLRQIDGDIIEESISLDISKANRLINLYRNLAPGHSLECHDVVKEVEGWAEDYGTTSRQIVVQPESLVENYEPNLVSGNPYTVQIVTNYRPDLRFARTHSCYGMDNNRMLGILGQGLIMATMSPEDTRTVYSNGALDAFIARTDLDSTH